MKSVSGYFDESAITHDIHSVPTPAPDISTQSGVLSYMTLVLHYKFLYEKY